MGSHYLDLAIQGMVAVALIAFGEWSSFVKVFVILMGLDYLTGILRAVKDRELNSNMGMVGIIKKLGYFVVIAAFFQVGQILGDGEFVRKIVLNLFIVNEFISVVENVAKLGDSEGYMPEGVVEFAERLVGEQITNLSQLNNDSSA